MGSTSQQRARFPEVVVGRKANGDPICDTSILQVVKIPAFGNEWPFKVHPATTQLWEAVAAINRNTGFQAQSKASGTHNCRKTASGFVSLHAHGLAFDQLPAPPNKVIDLYLAVRTAVTNEQAFRSGRDWNDAMHLEVTCSRAGAEFGPDWSTVTRGARPPLEDEMIVKQGDKGPIVGLVQRLLKAVGEDPGKIDNLFGPKTTQAVMRYQSTAMLNETGIYDWVLHGLITAELARQDGSVVSSSVPVGTRFTVEVIQ
jgi:hypothetical protein